MRLRFSFAFALFLTFGAAGLAGAQVSAMGPRSFARVYVENRCYNTLDTTLVQEREKAVMKGSGRKKVRVMETVSENIRLAPVSPRTAGLVHFTWTKNLLPDDRLVLSRRDAPSMSLSVQEFLAASGREQWKFAQHSVDSWLFVACPKELPLDDPAGKTVRAAKPQETLAEYEMLFSREPGSTDPMHVYADYPVRVSLNGYPLHVIRTSTDGRLRMTFGEGVGGIVMLEALPGIRQHLALGDEWQPVRLKKAEGGERVLVAPRPVMPKGEW